MTQEHVGEEAALRLATLKFQRSPVIVPGKVVVFKVVVAVPVVIVRSTAMRLLSIGLRAARMTFEVLARLRDIITR